MERLDLLHSFVTPEVLALVRGRLLEGLKFYGTTKLRPGLKREDVKLALILVQIANPKELLTIKESELIEAPMRQQKVNGSSGESHLNEKTEVKASKQKRRKPTV